MEVVIVIALGLLLWKYNELKGEIRELREGLLATQKIVQKQGYEHQNQAEALSDQKPMMDEIPDPPEGTRVKPPTEIPVKSVPEVLAAPLPTARKKKTAAKKAPKKSFGDIEKQFGEKLPVWIGGIALILGGLFLIKYSIESGILTPFVRVVSGGVIGAAFLMAANFIRQKKDIANGVRISQSLSGAGIGVLYLSVFAATTLYGFLPNIIGFAGMACITALTVLLSLRHGPPIALLGLLGGFATPALIGSDSPSAALLFSYLLVLFGGLMTVIRRQKWWVLSLPALFGLFLWVFVWLVTSFSSNDSIWLSLFLMGVSAIIIYTSRDQWHEDLKKGRDAPQFLTLLNLCGLGGSVVIMALITTFADYSTLEWSFFGLLSLASIALAYFDHRLYRFLPPLALATNLVMLLFWSPGSIYTYATVLLAFAIMFAGISYLLMHRTCHRIYWALMSNIAAGSFYLLAYFRISILHSYDITSSIPLFWGLLAVALAGVATYSVAIIHRQDILQDHKEKLMALFAVSATSFIATCFATELDLRFIPIALAFEVLAIAWINNRFPIQSLRTMMKILFGIICTILLPHIMSMLQASTSGYTGGLLSTHLLMLFSNNTLIYFLMPALLMLSAGHILHQKSPTDVFVKVMDGVSMVLITVTGYYLTRDIFYSGTDLLLAKADFMERGIITNVFFALSILAMISGRYLSRPGLSWGGTALFALAMTRVIWFDLMIYNPLWSYQEIEGWVLFNTLLLPFGLPIFWSMLASKEMQFIKNIKWQSYVPMMAMVCLFILITLNVRFMFQGEYLNGSNIENAEIYAYSVVWLLLGVGLLIGGILKKDQTLRYASLAVILLTVSKVFLYDASELEGLYRVFSFFGLGLSLLGLSWFYSRFVFQDTEKIEEHNPSE